MSCLNWIHMYLDLVIDLKHAISCRNPHIHTLLNNPYLQWRGESLSPGLCFFPNSDAIDCLYDPIKSRLKCIAQRTAGGGDQTHQYFFSKATACVWPIEILKVWHSLFWSTSSEKKPAGLKPGQVIDGCSQNKHFQIILYYAGIITASYRYSRAASKCQPISWQEKKKNQAFPV